MFSSSLGFEPLSSFDSGVELLAAYFYSLRSQFQFVDDSLVRITKLQTLLNVTRNIIKVVNAL